MTVISTTPFWKLSTLINTFHEYAQTIFFSSPFPGAILPRASSLSLYTGPKVQAHHLLIRQKECNEIINVLELIMNMIKKAKISGARISLPIQS